MTWSTNAVTYLGGVISAHNIAQKDIGLRKQGAHLVDSRTSGSLNNTTSRPKSVSLLYGAGCRRIVATDVNKLNVFITAAYGRVATSIGETKSFTTTCTRRLDVRASILRLRSAGSDG